MPSAKATATTAASKVRQLKPQSFISSIVKDPAKPPRLRMICGYIGEASEKGHIRVYLDAELRRYVDVPSEGIVHSESIPESTSPLGGTLIWVREEMKIRHYGSWASGEDPTTMATGEEGGGDPTTMATGEEGGGFMNPADRVINPFGRF